MDKNLLFALEIVAARTTVMKHVTASLQQLRTHID
jgi:hypothetical protein